MFLFERGLIDVSDGRTAPRVAAHAPEGGRRRWLLPVSFAAAMAVVAGLATVQLSGFTEPPAQVRVAASPWAAIRIDDGASFHTPSAVAVPLAPGEHTIRFEHPTYGEIEYTIEVAAGESRLIRHVFKEGTR